MKTFNEWLDNNIKYKFNQIAEMQKKIVLNLNQKIQELNIDLLNFVIKAPSDIIILMNQESGWNDSGYNEIYDIVNKLTEVLNNNFNEKLESNISHTANKKNIDEDFLRQKSYQILEEYEKECKKLPEYNAAQSLTKIICRKIGKKQWNNALNKLETLKNKLQTPEMWMKFSKESINVFVKKYKSDFAN